MCCGSGGGVESEDRGGVAGAEGEELGERGPDGGLERAVVENGLIEVDQSGLGRRAGQRPSTDSEAEGQLRAA